MHNILTFCILLLIGIFIIFMFERYGANLVVNGSLKRIFYKNLRNKFKDLKYHNVNEYIFEKNGQTLKMYWIFKNNNTKTIFRFHPILNCRVFDICNKKPDFNLITFELVKSYNSIYEHRDIIHDAFETVVKTMNLNKQDVILHSSCAFTNMTLSIAEKYPHLYSKLILEEPMIDFHKIINRSIKQIRFITPLLNKELYPDCISKVYNLENPTIIICSSQDKITTVKDCYQFVKHLNCNDLKIKFIEVKFKINQNDKKTKNSIRFRGTHAHLFKNDEYFNTIEKFIIK